MQNSGQAVRIDRPGKIRRGNTGMNHLKMSKSAAAKRRLNMKSGLCKGEKRVIRRLVPGL